MKRISLITAVILSMLLSVFLGACGDVTAGEPASGSAPDKSVNAEASSADRSVPVSVTPAREELLASMLHSGRELRYTPLRRYAPLSVDGSDEYYDFAGFDRTLEGTYAVRFRDLDDDGEEELLAFELVPTGSGDESDPPVYQLHILVFDRTGNDGVMVSEADTGFTTDALYYLEGSMRCWAVEKDGTVAVLYNYNYDTSEYTYRLYGYKDGGITEELSRRFSCIPPGPGEDGVPEVVGGIPGEDGLLEDSRFSGEVGSDDVTAAIKETDEAIAAAGLEPLLFPLQPDGEPKSGDVFEEQCDFRFGIGMDEELEREYLFIEDMTRSYENTPIALKTGGTRIFTVAQWELALTHDSAGLHAEYDEDDVSIRFYVSEHTKNHFVAISPLRDTEDGAVRIVDNDDADNAWTVRYTAGAGGRETYEYTSVPDAGALFGAAPSGFSAADRFYDGGTDFYLTYDVSDPAFGGKSAEQILDEYVEAAEENGFDLITDMPNNNGGRTRSLSTGQTEFTVSYYDEPDTGVTLTVQFTLKSIQ